MLRAERRSGTPRLRRRTPEHVDLVLADLVGHHEDAGVAALLSYDRQADAGVARGRFDDRAARLELPLTLGRVDHAQRDAVLHRATRVEVLDLGVDRRPVAR